MADPPGLRACISGLTGRVPLRDADAANAAETCGSLLLSALDGDAAELARVLAGAKLPDIEAAQ